jgi:hypothetical protein
MATETAMATKTKAVTTTTMMTAAVTATITASTTMTTTTTTTMTTGDGDGNGDGNGDSNYDEDDGYGGGGIWRASRRRGVGQVSGGQGGENGNKSEMGTMWVLVRIFLYRKMFTWVTFYMYPTEFLGY